MTAGGKLRIVENRAHSLDLQDDFNRRNLLNSLQETIALLDLRICPVQVRDRLLLIGKDRIFSFSTHPHRWLQDGRETPLPEGMSAIFAAEAYVESSSVLIPVECASAGAALLKVTIEELVGGKIAGVITNVLDDIVPIGSLDIAGRYYWAKDRAGVGKLLIRRSDLVLTPVSALSDLFFLVRPEMVGERVFAVSSEQRLLEISFHKDESKERRLAQVGQGVRIMRVLGNRVVIAKHDRLVFYDIQTGECLGDVGEVEATHMFQDSGGMLLVLHHNGQLLLINPIKPLERRILADATSDDSSVADAFIVQNSLYSLSEDGEVCRFDFN